MRGRTALVIVAGVLLVSANLLAQGRGAPPAPAGGRGAAPAGGRAAAPPPPTPRTQAPFDPTGYWVAIISEDWRWRMITPAKGDFPSIPLSRQGQRVAEAWDPAKDEAAGE